MHDQISLILQRLFAALENFPSHSQSPPYFFYICGLLLGASKVSTTTLSLRVAREVVVQGITTVMRKTKSISLALALALAQSATPWVISSGYLEISERPFVKIDKVMLELWSEQEGVEGRTQENLEIWQESRLMAMDKYSINLEDLNGSLPIWNASATRTGPSKLDRFLSVFGIDRVCPSYTSAHLAFSTSLY